MELAEKLLLAAAEHLEVEFEDPALLKHLMSGSLDKLSTADAASALQIAKEVCAVIAVLNTSVCPLVNDMQTK